MKDKILTENVSSVALKLMGNRVEISAVAVDKNWANECIDAAIYEIQRIEKLLMTFSEDSETSLINKNAGIAHY